MVNSGWSDRDGQVGGTYPSTNNPVQFKRHGSDVISWSHVASVASETVTFGSTTSIISSGTDAKVGDLIQFTSGVNSGSYTSVREVIGTLYYFSQKFSTEPSIGDSFNILRYKPQTLSSSGASVVDTELPDATLLADGDAIPTAPKVGAVMMAKNTSGTLDIAKLAKAHDMDTGAGEEYGTGVSLRFAASGGSVANTVSDSIDSRVGLDIQHSSIASYQLINFSSLIDTPLAANAYKIFSPLGTRGSYYDFQGYGNLLLNICENSSGGAPGTLYAIWSNDGTNTPYNDPGDGSGITNYAILWSSASNNPTNGALFPLGGRYGYFVYKNGPVAQSAFQYQHAEINVKLVPTGFTSRVTIDNPSISVKGVSDPATAAQEPVLVGGVDNIAAPTVINPLLISSAGEASLTEFPAPATLADATANPSLSKVQALLSTFNATTWDRRRNIINATNSTGTGIAAAGLVAQLDDTSPTAITENQFGNIRMSPRRAMHVTKECQGNASTFTAAANGTAIDLGAGTAYKHFSLQVKATGAVTSWTVVLEGSLDGTNYSTILTHTNAAPGDGLLVPTPAAAAFTPHPVRYFRARCSAIVLGGGTNVVATILGVP